MPFEFAAQGKCSLAQKTAFFCELDHHYDPKEGRAYNRPYNAWCEIEWDGQEFELFSITVAGNHCDEQRHYLVGRSRKVCEGFFEAVCTWHSEVREEVLVFSEGHWHKSEDLFKSIKTSTLDNIILEGALKDETLTNFQHFFGSKTRYEKHNIPWKRGVLFLGAPGNGKTHMVKALVNNLDKPCLYVRSFTSEYFSSHQCISSALERARDTAPCVFVLEDLDSLVDDQNRSFFLNEMDGFFSNMGILTLATTNHPERLDPAILERPSRFDRKYTFNLPGMEERLGYVAMMNADLEAELRLDQEEEVQIAAATEEFSFAYLKELFLSAMMAWISKEDSPPMVEVMLSQVASLRSQMSNVSVEPSEPVDPDDMIPPYMKFARRRTRSMRR